MSAMICPCGTIIAERESVRVSGLRVKVWHCDSCGRDERRYKYPDGEWLYRDPEKDNAKVP
jgi:protocatechuate 3,4-dioxygenase beta subunit